MLDASMPSMSVFVRLAPCMFSVSVPLPPSSVLAPSVANKSEIASSFSPASMSLPSPNTLRKVISSDPDPPRIVMFWRVVPSKNVADTSMTSLSAPPSIRPATALVPISVSSPKPPSSVEIPELVVTLSSPIPASAELLPLLSSNASSPAVPITVSLAVAPVYRRNVSAAVRPIPEKSISTSCEFI